MDDFTTDWTHQELKAYMLLYCANADLVVSKEEKEFIKSKVSKEEYRKIHRDIEKDNDYQQIQKINAAIERFDYSKEEIDEAFQSIKDLFLSDGELDTMEQAIYRGLKNLLMT